MVASSASEAVGNANRYSTCEPGMCLKYTRTWLEIGSYYGSAADAWEGALFRHPGDRHPPSGAPVFYQGGQHGHVALSVGSGKVRSTDRPSSGNVSTVALSDPEHAWGYPYLGWTEDLNGVSIPYLEAPPPAPPAPPKDDDAMIYYDVCSPDVTNAPEQTWAIIGDEWRQITGRPDMAWQPSPPSGIGRLRISARVAAEWGIPGYA